MLFRSTVAAVALAIPAMVSAFPFARRQAPAPQRFYLRTQVVPGINDSGTNKSDLYLVSYHTGAGLGVAAGAPGEPDDAWFYLNGTELYWTYTNNTIGPWPVKLEYYPYAAFNPISISIADGPATPGFSVNATGLQQNQTNGWLACDWAYSYPQVFALDTQRGPLPTSCSKVNFIAVPLE